MSNKFTDLIKPTSIIPTGEESFKLSLEDMAAELSITPSGLLNPADLATPSLGQPTRTKSFLMQRYTLLATPLFTVYIQGVLPIKEDTSLSFFLTNSVLKVNGHPLFKTSPTICDTLITRALELQTSFYSSTARDAHIELIAEISKLVKINPSKCLSKSSAEQAIETYLTDLANFLVSEGFNSPLDWIAKNKSTNSLSALTYEDLKELSNSIVDF